MAAPPSDPPLEPHPFAIPRFASFVGDGLSPTAGGRSVTLATSMAIHAVLIAAIIVVPLFFEEVLPVPGDSIRAFFVSPAEAAPPPPPPPPPAPSAARALRRAPTAVSTPPPSSFVAPVEVPEEMPVPEQIDLGGVEGGVPGGVEGGVPGGVVGGIVGGLPAEPPPPRVVRIGGNITAPKLAHAVKPEYPMLARDARLKGTVVLEAHVAADGPVKSVRPLSGPVLLQDAAVAAVKQWRYQPLLLNGQAVEFILIVTVNFNLYQPAVVQ